MKKYLQRSIVVGTLVLAGCGTSGAPSCSDDDVQELVQEISEQTLQSQVFKRMLSQAGIMIANPSYEIWKNDPPSDDPDINEIVAMVDAHVAKVNMEMGGIRINKQDDEIRKSECGATFSFSSGKSFPISYTAQYTEEDEIYVEVFGL